MAGRNGDDVLNRATLRVRGSGRNAPVAGAAFLIAPDLAITCAHVVSGALRLPPEESPSPDARITLELPFTGPGAAPVASTRVEHWIPAADDDSGDIAVLRLDAGMPGARALHMVEADDLWDHKVRVPGFPEGLADGVWHAGRLRGRTAQGWVQCSLDGPSDVPLTGGFSGGPVWDEALGGVVGMVVAAQPGGTRQGFVIPTRTLTEAVPSLTDAIGPGSPFRGLSAFSEDDAEVFFGRETEAEEVAALVRRQPQVTLVGPSGCGKSSLALAGVVPLLRRAAYEVVVVRPSTGRSLLSALGAGLSALLHPGLTGAEALSKAREVRKALKQEGLGEIAPLVLRGSQAKRLLIVVDQAEELLVCPPEEGQDAAEVLFPARPPDDMRVLLTLRADFLGAGLSHPALGSALGRAVYALTPMRREQLKEVIERPLEGIPAVDYAPMLVETILDDAGKEPGALPLLGFVLEKLWQERSHGQISFEAYGGLDGVGGALAKEAEGIWQDCVPKSDAAVGQALLTQLVRVSPGSEAAALRRVVPRADVAEDQWRIARALADRRLLVVGSNEDEGETVELAHEALIVGWPRLAEQVTADRRFLEWRAVLHEDVERWEQAGQTVEWLPRSGALAEAEGWLTKRRADLNAAELGYLDRWRRHERSRSFWKRAGWAGAVAVLMALAVLTTMLISEGQVSEDRAAEARSRALARTAADLARRDPRLSAMLAIEAFRSSPTWDARNQLLQRYVEHRDTKAIASGALGLLAGVDASADGRVVLGTTDSGTATLYVRSANGDYRLQHLPYRGFASQPAVSPDGTLVAYAVEDGSMVWHSVDPGNGWPLDDGHTLSRQNREKPEGFPARGADIVRSGDDGWIATTGPGTVVFQSLGVTAPEQAWTLDFAAESIRFGPDERTLVALRDGAVWVLTSVGRPLWRKVNLKRLGKADGLRVSGDGASAVVCTNSTEKNRQSATYTALRLPDGTQQGRYRSAMPCRDFAVDDSGRYGMILGQTGWELVDLRQGSRLSSTWIEAQEDPSPLALVDVPDSPALLTMTRDTVVLTSLRNREERFGEPALLCNGCRMVAQAEGGKKLRVSETGGGQRTIAEVDRSTTAPGLDVYGEPAVSEDERYVADPVAANKVVVRALPSLRTVTQVTTAMPPRDSAGDTEPLSYFFLENGELFTRAGRRLERWDVKTGRRKSGFDLTGPGSTIGQIKPSPWNSGQLLVAVRGRDYIHTVDLVTGKEVSGRRMQMGPGTIEGFTFDSSGRYLLVFRSGALPEVWLSHPLKKLLGPLRSVSENGLGATNRTFSTFVNQQHKLFLISDKEIHIYGLGVAEDGDGPDGVTYEGTYTFTLVQEFLGVSADGRTLLRLRAGDETEGYVSDVLPLDVTAWERRVCEVLGRDLTDDDRKQVSVELPTRICPG
ncbi:trypsin-like peptidase domain-containing protein [Nonomuraea sp. M3C6]|uniref:Trypsin-like peptidase domain-containing protein n=1 Tax=Nonomuraea marmarensis TaxID=3351344 RepID=A0ABW7A4I4_9ACTN